MRWASLVGWSAAAVMVAAISYGFAAGDFGDEGSQILDLAWGRVSLIDLYAGLALFVAWVVYRERSPVRSLIWIVLLVVTGNLAAGAYVGMAAGRSGGSAGRFFMGDRVPA